MYEIPTRKKGEPDKFQPKRRGPYRILSKLSDQSYFIRLPNPITGGEKVSARRLILYSPQDTPNTGGDCDISSHTYQSTFRGPPQPDFRVNAF